MSELAAWDSFYVIVGSAAGALIGLQFVVVTLIAQRPTRASPDASAAFGTPTIVHFGATLLLAALLRAPWPTITAPAVLWGLVGFGGFCYAVIVLWRMRRQGAYEPEFEDWLFHIALPMAAYAALTVSAFATIFLTHEALFAVGAAALLLLFIGIHNAWDAVFYHVFLSKRSADDDGR
jgi:energy-converting hydrogenase Eha subunit A